MNEMKDPTQGQSAGEQSIPAPAKKTRGAGRPPAAKKESGETDKKKKNTTKATPKSASSKQESPEHSSPDQTQTDATPPSPADSKKTSTKSSTARGKSAPKSGARGTAKGSSTPSRGAKSGKPGQGKAADAASLGQEGAAPAEKADGLATPALEGNKNKALEGNSQHQLTGSTSKALPASAAPALEASHREAIETVAREAIEGRSQKALEQGAEAGQDAASHAADRKPTGRKPAGKGAAPQKSARKSAVKGTDASATGTAEQESPSRRGRQAKKNEAKTADSVQPEPAKPDSAPETSGTEATGTEATGTETSGTEATGTVPQARPSRSSRGRGRRSGAKKSQPESRPETGQEAVAKAGGADPVEVSADVPVATLADTAAPAEGPDAEGSGAKETGGRRKSSSGRGRGGRKPKARQEEDGATLEAHSAEDDQFLERETDFALDEPFGDTGAGMAFDEDAEEVELIETTGKAGQNKKGQPQPVKQVRRKMFVCVHPEEQVEVVLTEEGQVQEYFVEMLQQAKTKGNIYKAVINNLDANLQAAFISYGANKNGFLQIDEVHPEYFNNPHDSSKNRRYPPIQKALKQGQELLVQVVKEPSGTKGAFLTTYLSLPGRFLVLTPGREQIGVSRKVDNEEERSRLREMLTGLKPGPGLGVIVRTVSVGTSKSTLQKDLQNLKRTWKEIRKRGTEEPAPALIYQEMSLTTRAVRDYLTDQVVEVWIDDEETAKSVEEMAKIHFPQKNRLVNLHKDTNSTLFERFNLQRQLDQIHSREVTLPSGGRLVIDPTEALTAIDINSGRSGGKNNFEDMAYRTNIEAARMIPLQLRLRDIGGQVVIDFIEMRDKSHWREVEKTIRAGMKNDRARHDVGRVSPFGLMEMVRQRLGSSAISVSTEVCPHCKGTGMRRNMEWQTQAALREIDRKLQTAKEQNQPILLFEVEGPVAMHLLNTKRQRLVEMEQQFGVHLEIVPTH